MSGCPRTLRRLTQYPILHSWNKTLAGQHKNKSKQLLSRLSQANTSNTNARCTFNQRLSKTMIRVFLQWIFDWLMNSGLVWNWTCKAKNSTGVPLFFQPKKRRGVSDSLKSSVTHRLYDKTNQQYLNTIIFNDVTRIPFCCRRIQLRSTDDAFFGVPSEGVASRIAAGGHWRLNELLWSSGARRNSSAL